MKKTFEFFLEGCAYLECIEYKEGIPSVRICISQLLLGANDSSNELVMHCSVKTLALFFLLQFLETKRLEGSTIIIKFRAMYSGFGSCLSGVTPEDPAHMLSLHGKLQWIEGWYQDGHWFTPDQALTEKKASPILGTS